MVLYSTTYDRRKRTELFFEGDDIKKLIYEEKQGVDGERHYTESDMNAKTNQRRTVLPKTARGREQPLTASMLRTSTYILALLQVILKGAYAGAYAFNSSNDQLLSLPPCPLKTSADFIEYSERYIASCPKDYSKRFRPLFRIERACENRFLINIVR